MEAQTAPPAGATSGTSRLAPLSLLLNAILLGVLLYTQVGARFAGDGVSLVIANETSSTMLEPTLAHPGGEFKLAELPAGKAVGTSIQVPGEFEATLTFKDAAGTVQSKKVKIKPIGELLVVVHVIPEPIQTEPEEPAPEAAKAEPTPPEVRVFVAYQGENVNI